MKKTNLIFLKLLGAEPERERVIAASNLYIKLSEQVND
jgi:hypothetical protein